MPLDYIPTACVLLIDWFIVPIAGIGTKLLATVKECLYESFCRTYCMDCFEGTDLYILWGGGETVVYMWRLLVCIHYDTLIYQYQKLNGLYPIFLLWLSLNWCLKEFVTTWYLRIERVVRKAACGEEEAGAEWRDVLQETDECGL